MTAERSEDVENSCVLSLSLGTFLSLYLANKEKEMYNYKDRLTHQNAYFGVFILPLKIDNPLYEILKAHLSSMIV